MLAIGMITCRRPNVDVHDAVDHLRFGGFKEALHIFCEPDSPAIRPLDNVIVHQNERRFGVLGNWSHCLDWLLENTDAEHLMVCEDDVVYAEGAREIWSSDVGKSDQVGFWSLYTPRRDQNLVGHTQGWIASNRGRDTWGTQAICFPRSSARIVIDYPPLRNEDQFSGPTDAIVAQCFVEAGLPCFYHNPSLADHLGRVSSVGHNWYDEHVGLNFDRHFGSVNNPTESKSVVHLPEAVRPAGPDIRRSAVVTLYPHGVAPEVARWHQAVVSKFLPVDCIYDARCVANYAVGLDDYFRNLPCEVILVLSVDCIPLTSWAISWMLENASSGILIGATQRALHVNNGEHVFVGPGAMALSRTTFERLQRPSFRATSRGEVGEELTYKSEETGVRITRLWPTHVAQPKWYLWKEIRYGPGTTYAGAFYHAFEISNGQTVEMFLNKCREVLARN